MDFYRIIVMDWADTHLETHKVNPEDLQRFIESTLDRYGVRANTEYIHFDIRPMKW